MYLTPRPLPCTVLPSALQNKKAPFDYTLTASGISATRDNAKKGATQSIGHILNTVQEYKYLVEKEEYKYDAIYNIAKINIMKQNYKEALVFFEL